MTKGVPDGIADFAAEQAALGPNDAPIRLWAWAQGELARYGAVCLTIQ